MGVAIMGVMGVGMEEFVKGIVALVFAPRGLPPPLLRGIGGTC